MKVFLRGHKHYSDTYYIVLNTGLGFDQLTASIIKCNTGRTTIQFN